MRQHAFLLDGGFVCKRLQALDGTFPTAERVLDYCHELGGHSRLSSSALLRIYFYDAPPASDWIIRPLDRLRTDMSQSPIHKQNQILQRTLAESADVALRLGELRNRGWKIGPRAMRDLRKVARTLEGSDFIPDFAQKGVDLRIGLDIARLSLGGLVDTIVLITGDSDFIPAMKFARREGVKIYLDAMGQGSRHELLAHADFFFPPQSG